ncbi:MAG TPA: benzoate-CoA ligase family protein [Acidobacteriota bacterium]|jgi:benzoate-CoA ligase|nr:benzoate-CoA ligase family protein [Acidobacteriota bacterium]HJO30715.1 benzoate-CoA ligase family protein [Acidobacteriota bacterium]
MNSSTDEVAHYQSSYPQELNIAQRLADGALANGWGKRTAFHYRGSRVSFAEVREDTARFASVLFELEVAAEQRILIALPDTPAFLTCFLGTIWHGSVAVPINPYLPLDRYEFFLRDSRAVAAIVPPWLVGTVIDLSERLPALQHIVVFSDPGTPEGGSDDGGWRTPNLIGSASRLHDAADLLEGAIASPPAPTSCDEPAFWLYTSGSTGLPKGAIHLHHDIWVAADCWGQRTMGMGPDDVHLSASKLYFAYGLGNSLHCPMWSGGSAVLIDERPTPSNMTEAIAANKVTHFYAVPSFYNAMMTDDGFSAAIDAGLYSSLEVCVSAGEALPAPLCDQWMKATGVPVLDGIGSTELLHIFIANRSNDIRPGCSGRPILGYDARVVNEDGNDVSSDVVGDLWVSGDSACIGYWNRHEATKQALRGKWFVTGDKYRVDSEGYYWYAGRADDMFKVHGQWVSPSQVESVLLEHEGVREVAVVAATNDRGLSCGLAFVVPVGSANKALTAALLKHAAGSLSRYLVPETIKFVDELPKTPTGKIQRYLLRDQME